MNTIQDNLSALHLRLQRACDKAGRSSSSVQVLAVSKTFDAQAVQQAMAAGQTSFGENYIQEGVAKIKALAAMSTQTLEWHCIGPIQTNKSRLVAEHFDWVQSLDRLQLAQRLSNQRPAGLPPLQVCIQINVDGSGTKSGIAPAQLLDLAHAIAPLPHLQLRGLMCITDPQPSAAATQALFERAQTAFQSLKHAGFEMDTLSMGMSDDLEAAVAAGSTLIRVGRGIFGNRAAPTEAHAL
jgi:hypothetical protein